MLVTCVSERVTPWFRGHAPNEGGRSPECMKPSHCHCNGPAVIGVQLSLPDSVNDTENGGRLGLGLGQNKSVTQKNGASEHDGRGRQGKLERAIDRKWF